MKVLLTGVGRCGAIFVKELVTGAGRCGAIL